MTVMNSINKSKDIFTVIDVGNSKVSCLIGSPVRSNNVQIKALGFGQHASLGMSNGQVTDMKEIANSIARAVESAETMAGFNINKVICNLSGGRPITKIIRNKLKIENGRVEKSDVIKILKFKNNYQIDKYEILSSSVIKYYLDNNTCVDNPIGIFTNTLTVEMNYTYGEKTVIKNLSSAVNLCHLSVEKFFICSEASGISTMLQDERSNGAVIIDLGANITSIGVFLNNKIIFSDSLPIGGVHITSDIVRGLGTKSEDAEKIKILHGSALSHDTDEYINIDIPIISDQGDIITQKIPKAMLTAIIKPRVEEIFELVQERLSQLQGNSNYINKVILCGGGANLNNIRELASKYFKFNVRIGRPIGLIDLPEIVQSPSFACLTGLLIKSLEKEEIFNIQKMEKGVLKYFGKLGNWFDQNL
jgi:cell division protein FtsA